MPSSANSLFLESSVRSNPAVLGRGVFFKLCQKFLIVPKLCKTRFAHSPWILLISCTVTDRDLLQLQLLTEQRNPCTEGLLLCPGSPTESEHRLLLLLGILEISSPQPIQCIVESSMSLI